MFVFQFSVSISGFFLFITTGWDEILAGKGTFLREWRLCPLQCYSVEQDTQMEQSPWTGGAFLPPAPALSISCHQRYLVVKNPSPWGNPSPSDQSNSKMWSNFGNPSTDNFSLKSWDGYIWKGSLRSSWAAVIPAPPLTPSATSSKFLHGWWLHHCPGQPTAVLNSPLGEEMLSNMWPKPPLVQSGAVSSCPVTCHSGEGTEPTSLQPPLGNCRGADPPGAAFSPWWTLPAVSALPHQTCAPGPSKWLPANSASSSIKFLPSQQGRI